MNLKWLAVLFLVVRGLDAKSIMDFSYSNGSDGFNKYSVSYITSVSSRIFSGINYSLYNGDNIENTGSFRLPLSYVNKNYIFSLKPFYYPPKNGASSSGFKTSFGIVRGEDEIYATYYLSAALSNKKNASRKNRDFVTEASVEKNFYDEFFIMARGGINLNYDRKNYGVTDNSDMMSYSFIGVINFTVYSNIGFNFARSFKPDFNSYLYLSFDRINGYIDDVNSYLLGLKVFLDEKENYFMDFNYNFADFKKSSNSKFFKVSVGVDF